ncbi:MAG TPA: TetR family transcriptional regulator C-terminal domain-containing protein [Methylomirabilota bacterium]|nr:TetR family transcriptional regulator C-terminal domain-containing protein [Methylomirabilota bacterium]
MSPKVGVAPVRREQIVRATVRCLARVGYTRLTMKQVAREAAVSQGILHYYFADKRAMLVATLEVIARDLDRRVAAAQSRTGRDPRARLRALVRACLEVAVGRPEYWIVFVEFWGEMLHDRRLRDLNTEVYARTRRLIARLVAEGVRAGRFRAVDPARAAAVVLGLIDGLSLQLTFDPEAFSVAEVTRFCDDALGRYLAKEAP